MVWAKIKNIKLSGLLFKRRAAFRTVFDDTKPEVKTVLAELRKFCPSDPVRTAGKPVDDRQVYINIGRRQVLSFIAAQINMPDERIEEIAREEINGRY